MVRTNGRSVVGNLALKVAEVVGAGVAALTVGGIPYDVTVNNSSVYEAATDPLNLAIAGGIGLAVVVGRSIRRRCIE